MIDKRLPFLIVVLLFLGACESENEHFCTRYQYVYNQLIEEDDLPSYDEMRAQLMQNMDDPKKDKQQAKFMLFVLDDWNSEIIPDGGSARDFCMQIQRWKNY